MRWCSVLPVLIIAGLIAAAAAGWGLMFYSDRQHRVEHSRLTAQAEALERENRQLRSRLAPFEDLADERYGEVEKDQALAELRSDLRAAARPGEGRRLSSQQRQEISKLFGAAEQEGRVVMICAAAGDAEAAGLAGELRAAITAGGWQAGKVVPAVSDGFRGVIIEYGGERAPTCARGLRDILLSGGLEANEEQKALQDPKVIVVKVGPRR